MHDKQKRVLTDCLDLMALVPHLEADNARCKLAQDIVDTLGDYPRTQPGCGCDELGAYLLVSSSRNAAKLAMLEVVTYPNAFNAIQSCLEHALGLLVDNES